MPYLPLLIDGGAHLIGDSLRLGFRANTAWLAALTSNSLPAAFYAGDASGSFSRWLRLLTGLLAGFAFVRQVYPHLDRGMAVLAWDERAGQGALV